MTTIKDRIILGATLVVLAIGGIAFRGATSATSSPSVTPTVTGQAEGVSREKILPSEETGKITVWRNGAMHEVHVPLDRVKVTSADGSVAEEVRPRFEDMESQLPPLDPNDKREATPEQIAAIGQLP